MINKLKTQLKY